MSPPAEHNICLQHLTPQKVNIWGRFGGCEEGEPAAAAELPSRSCCVSAALDTAPPVCCGPARPGCARSAADPSPSSLGAASSAESLAASGRSGAPPAAKMGHFDDCAHQLFCRKTVFSLVFLDMIYSEYPICVPAHQLGVFLDDGLQFLLGSAEFVQTLHQQHGLLP